MKKSTASFYVAVVVTSVFGVGEVFAAERLKQEQQKTPQIVSVQDFNEAVKEGQLCQIDAVFVDAADGELTISALCCVTDNPQPCCW